MNIDKKIEIVKNCMAEVITEQDLRELFERKRHPIAYDGFEPSGLSHLAFGVYRPLLVKELMKTGIGFKIYLADWFAWINNKSGGDLDNIKTIGKYFMEVWRAAGVPFGKGVKSVWASDLVQEKDYWKNVIRVAKNTSVKRAERALTIMGRKKGEMNEVAQYFYPMMQCTDIFMLGADITQLGMDQRKVNVLAREVAPKIGYQKPVAAHHKLIMGLEGPKNAEGFDENKNLDVAISSKMSKSKPKSTITVHDSEKEINEKIKKAYCPPKIVANNPILDYSKELIFRLNSKMKVERPKKFGGNVEYDNYSLLELEYIEGKIHPLDLKNSVSRYVNDMVKPLRRHFETNRKASDLLKRVKKIEFTR